MTRPFTLAVFLLALLMFIAGCGGGGGDSTTGGTTGGVAGTLRYETTFGTRDPSSGASQLVSVIDASGTTISTKLLNASTGTTLDFENLTEGTYTVHAVLYSQEDASGATLGSLDVPFTMGGSGAKVNSAVGDPVTNVGLNPPSATIDEIGTQQFIATAYTASGAAVFVSDNSFVWSQLGGVVTVDGTGRATPVAVGSGSVRATHAPSGIIGSASISISAVQTQRSKWTVLVYLNAANDLYTYSDANVNQMERVADNSQLRFVVQWKQSRSIFPNSSFNGTRRYLVKPDNSTSIKSQLVQDMGGDVDMGSTQTLNEFVKWGKKYYPADRYVLVIWNHGSGWKRGPEQTRGVSFDDEKGTSIETWELDTALQGENFDVLAWDASLMQMMEVAYEVRNHATYVAGSEESPPGEGYPYDLVFQGFRNNPDASTAQLSQGFVTGMTTYDAYVNRKITQSVIESSKLGNVAQALDLLGSKLMAGVMSADPAVATAFSNAVKDARTNAQSYSPNSVRTYRDLWDVCRVLQTHSGLPADTLAAAAAVQTAISQSLVWEGHNTNSANSHGISVDFSKGTLFGTFSADYRLMKLAQDTGWDEFLAVAP